MKLIINNGYVVNEGLTKRLSLLIDNGVIIEVSDTPYQSSDNSVKVIDAEGKYVIPGIIDTHVHFREPGLTHKADTETESCAAAAGGVTTTVDMPNTSPATTTIEAVRDKYKMAEEKSLTNYSFYIAATNNNIDSILKLNPAEVFGVKVFMGSSTGDMLVDNNQALERLFRECRLPISTHCEDEGIIKRNLAIYKERYAGGDAPTRIHAEIRSRESCLASTTKAVEWALKYGTKLNLLHLSTADEIEYLRLNKQDNITAEVCVSHLYFDDNDYSVKGNLIKCNPSIKSKRDRLALLQAVKDDIVEIISTDHAPHTLEEKLKPYFDAPSGIPTIQYSLLMMLELYNEGVLPLTTIVEKMCHAPTYVFGISRRGFIRQGYYADIAIIDMNDKTIVNKQSILSKCGWSPIEGKVFNARISSTIVNGNLVYDNGSIVQGSKKGMKIEFER